MLENLVCRTSMIDDWMFFYQRGSGSGFAILFNFSYLCFGDDQHVSCGIDARALGHGLQQIRVHEKPTEN
jgi:hypothetical protein